MSDTYQKGKVRIQFDSGEIVEFNAAIKFSEVCFVGDITSMRNLSEGKPTDKSKWVFDGEILGTAKFILP